MAQQPSNRSGGFGRTLGTILKVLLRLLVVLIVGTLIGAGIYLGIPWLYRATVVPVQENTDAIADLTQRMTLTETETDRTADALQDRTADMEGEIVALQETSAVNSVAVATAVARLDALETQASELTTTTEAQAEAQTALRKDLDAVTRTLNGLAADLEDQQEALTALDEDLGSRLTALEAQADALALAHSDAQARLVLLQSAQGLIRVQLQLLEDNTGTARNGLAIVVDHLNRYSALVPEQSEVASGLVTRIQEVDALIEERSFRTTPTLEALWADIVAMALPPLPVTAGTAMEVGATDMLTSTGGLTTTVGVTSTVVLTSTTTLTTTTTPTSTPTPSPTPTATPRP